MDIKFDCVGLWHAREVAALVEQQFGVRPEVSTTEGEVIIHPRPRVLSSREAEWLRGYLLKHSQKSSAERGNEFEQAERLRFDALMSRVARVTDDTSVSLVAEDVRDALRAMAELMGVEL